MAKAKDKDKDVKDKGQQAWEAAEAKRDAPRKGGSHVIDDKGNEVKGSSKPSAPATDSEGGEG